MSKSRIRRGGIAPPHGLMRPPRSSSRPCARGAQDRPPPSPRKDRRRRPRRRRFPPLSLDCAHRHTPAPTAVSGARRRWGCPRAHPARNDCRQRGGDEKQERFADEDDRVGRPRATVPDVTDEIHADRSQKPAKAEGQSLAPRPTGPSACPRATPNRPRRDPSSTRSPRRRMRHSRRRARRPPHAEDKAAPATPAAAIATSERAEARQPPTVQSLNEPRMGPADQRGGDRDAKHSGEERRRAGRRRAWWLRPASSRKRGPRTARREVPVRCKPASTRK